MGQASCGVHQETLRSLKSDSVATRHKQQQKIHLRRIPGRFQALKGRRTCLSPERIDIRYEDRIFSQKRARILDAAAGIEQALRSSEIRISRSVRERR